MSLKEKKESFNLKYLSSLSILKLAKTTKDVLCMTPLLFFVILINRKRPTPKPVKFAKPAAIVAP